MLLSDTTALKLFFKRSNYEVFPYRNSNIPIRGEAAGLVNFVCGANNFMFLRIHDFILLIEVKKKTVSPLFFVKSENFYGISVYFALLT